jgi:glutathione S-transferase
VLRLFDYQSSGNCYKVRLALSHLGHDYERVPVDIFGGDTLSPEYGEKNPALTTPVLEYAPGSYLPESGAILLFLSEGSDLLPDEPAERAQVHRWLFFEQSTVLPTIAMLRFRLLTGRLEPDAPEAEQAKRVAGAVTATVDGQLREREFLVGDRFTVADIALYGYLHVAHEAGVDTSGFAHLGAWIERVRGQSGHIDDLKPYPDNARPGQGRSIWDAFES